MKAETNGGNQKLECPAGDGRSNRCHKCLGLAERGGQVVYARLADNPVVTFREDLELDGQVSE
jgi:hypothetical protein